MNENRAVNSINVLIVSVIVAVGIFSSLTKSPISGWAAGNYTTDNYEKENSTFVWHQTLNEPVKDLNSLGFETINGTITIKPQKEKTSDVTVTGIIKIKRWFWGGQSSILRAKEKTGIATIRNNKDLLFKIEQPKYHFFKPVEIAIDLDISIPEGLFIPVRANTVNGKVEADSIKTSLKVGTVNGTIVLQNSGGPIDANTVNGNIQVENPLDFFNLGTVNGSVYTNVKRILEGNCSLHTVNGSVTAVIPKGCGFAVKLSTVNGRAHIQEKHSFQGESKKNHAKGTINGGGPTLSLSAVNGSVNIE